jgi:hypothetical protein
LDQFNSLLEKRADQIDPQLMDMLLTFTDYSQFKDLILSYKRVQMSIKKKSKKVDEFKEQQEKKMMVDFEVGIRNMPCMTG